MQQSLSSSSSPGPGLRASSPPLQPNVSICQEQGNHALSRPGHSDASASSFQRHLITAVGAAPWSYPPNHISPNVSAAVMERIQSSSGVPDFSSNSSPSRSTPPSAFVAEIPRGFQQSLNPTSSGMYCLSLAGSPCTSLLSRQRHTGNS